jgi:hypothetical protein
VSRTKLSRFAARLRHIAKAIVFSAVVIVALINASANAADFYWGCGSGNWNSTCWSNVAGGAPTMGPPQGAPVTSNYVYIRNTGPTDITVRLASDNIPIISLLSADATGAGSLTLVKTVDLRASGEQYGASGGNVTVNHLAGISSTLALALGSHTTYNLIQGAYYRGHI